MYIYTCIYIYTYINVFFVVLLVPMRHLGSETEAPIVGGPWTVGVLGDALVAEVRPPSKSSYQTPAINGAAPQLQTLKGTGAYGPSCKEAGMPSQILGKPILKSEREIPVDSDYRTLPQLRYAF